MTKKEMEDLLVEKYGYDRKELKDDKGNRLNNSVLEEMIAKEEANESSDKEGSKEESQDSFGLDETVFEANHNLDDKDLVLCMSGVNGDLNFSSPLSNFRVQTKDFGQTMKIPYGDLAYVHNIAPDAFEQGKIVILNKQVQKEFGLEDIYKHVITPKNVREVIKLDADELKDFLAQMPKAMKVSLYNEARKMYQQGKIDSIKTVKVIENEYNVSLEDNAPINNEVKQ